MAYTVLKGSIMAGSRNVPVFSVVDEKGFVYCNEDTQAKAEAHIPRLEAADARNAAALAARGP